MDIISEEEFKRRMEDSTIRVAKSIIRKLKEAMLVSPHDDIAIISRPQLEVIESALNCESKDT